MTVRVFKCEGEETAEDYGQKASYLGTILSLPNSFDLDSQHHFKTREAIDISGNTAKILMASHYAKHFKVEGDFLTHCGAFGDSEDYFPTVYFKKIGLLLNSILLRF